MSDQKRSDDKSGDKSKQKKEPPKHAVPKERGRTFGRTGAERQK